MTTSTVARLLGTNDQNSPRKQTDLSEDHEYDCSERIDVATTARLEFLNQQPPSQQQQPSSNDDKLPLKHPWGAYFYKADKQRDWKQNVIYITSINYVEDFWSFYTHTYGLRDLSNGSDYMLFKVEE